MGTVLAAIKLGWHQNGLVEPALFWQASLVDTAKEACGEKLDESTPGRPCTLSPEFGGANTPREYSGEIFPRIQGGSWVSVCEKKTPKSLFGKRDHYEILEIDTEFQTFLDDSTILDLVGHIITTFTRGI